MNRAVTINSVRKVLLVHNRYQQVGGEDTVLDSERKLLADHGHDVRLWSLSNDSISGRWNKLKTAWRTHYSLPSRSKILAELAAYSPDIVHVHNFFPLITPSIYDACQEAGVPVVQTLHNYRTVCAGATLMRKGKPCELCIHGNPYQAVLYRCYRDSRAASFVVARMVDYHRKHRTWERKVDRFIALTEFARNKFIEAGFPEGKIAIKPNFSIRETAPQTKAAAKRRGALFVGRLSVEKGVEPLLDAWRDLSVPLRIVGDGPMSSLVRRSDNPHIEQLGWLSSDEVIREMGQASFIVVPSLWYEGLPMVLVEAFAAGLPAIVSRLGSLAEIVEDGVTGLHFNRGDPQDLAEKIRWATKHPEEMEKFGRNARRVYKEKYTPEANYIQLIAIYNEAINEQN